jgi:hypothetical protein
LRLRKVKNKFRLTAVASMQGKTLSVLIPPLRMAQPLMRRRLQPLSARKPNKQKRTRLRAPWKPQRQRLSLRRICRKAPQRFCQMR